MYCDWSLLPELLLGFVNLSDEVDEPLPGLRDPLLRPVREVELPDGPRLAVPGISYLHTDNVIFISVNRQQP